MIEECDEIAFAMLASALRFPTADDARKYVRSRMPEESTTVIDNVAAALMQQQKGDRS